MSITRSINPIVGALLLSIFIVVGVFGMMAMPMDMMHHDCPFMPGEQAMCQMTPLDHISAWQGAFTGIVPSVITFLLLVAVIYVAFGWLDRPPNLKGVLRARSREQSPDIPNLLQELFSKGILNPKIP